MSLHEDRLEQDLLPFLLGNVFHVTTVDSYTSINSSGAILNSKDGRFSPTFPQASNSYGKKHGYVCLFDLRSIAREQLDDVLLKYYFLNPPFTDNNPVFMVIANDVCENLILWTVAKEASDGTYYIPYAEAWYPGFVPMASIEKVLEVEVVGRSSPQ